MHRTSVSALLFVVGATAASTPVLADDLLGFYVGAAFGQSHVRTSKEIIGDTNFDYDFDATHSAWKLTAGFRPIAPFGVEVEYLDFGNASGSGNVGFGGLTQADAKAMALFGVGYLPLPVPFLDVYGKLGVARLHTTVSEVAPVPVDAPPSLSAACPVGVQPCGLPGEVALTLSDWTTNVAFGVGVQGKFGPLAIRAEYERLGGSGDSPDLLSFGATWTF
jgi:hypothetical protein